MAAEPAAPGSSLRAADTDTRHYPLGTETLRGWYRGGCVCTWRSKGSPDPLDAVYAEIVHLELVGAGA